MSYRSRVIDGCISHWTFGPSSTPETFSAAFAEFVDTVARPEITDLIVEMNTSDPAGKDVLDLWLETGRLAELHGIRKWGVVFPEQPLVKRMAIMYQVKGGDERNRSYLCRDAGDADTILEWCRDSSA